MTQPMYFLPGLMCDQRLWQDLWPHLNEAFDPVHVTFGNHHNFPDMLKDVTAMLDLEPADMVGFSMGGYLALRYAIEHPGAVKRLAIIAATGTNLTEQEQRRRGHIQTWIKANDYSGIPEKRLSQFIHPDNLDGKPGQVVREMDRDLGKATLLSQLEASQYRPSLLEQAKALNIPVLVVGAEHDQLVSVDEIFNLAEQFDNVTVKIIPHGAHMIPLEAPRSLAHILNDFFAEGLTHAS